MSTRDPRDQKTGREQSERFAEPAAKAANQENSDSEQEARTEDFDVPKGEADYSEYAASMQAESGPAGLSRSLIDIKAQIEKALRQNAVNGAIEAESAFQGSSNIVGVGIGYGETHAAAGTPTLSTGVSPGEYALNVYVAELTSIDAIKAVIAESIGASEASYDSLPLNIIQTGLIQAQPNTARVRPAPGGYSVGHYKITAGTIGCYCVGNSAPRNSRLMALSNNHVLANVNSGVFGDCVVQPGPYDGGKCPPDQIAILERYVPINFAAGASNVVDCATAWTWPDRVRRELAYLSGGAIQYFRIGSSAIAPALGMIVGKTGRTTQLTTGRITGVGVTVNVSYGGGRVGHFVDQVSIQSVNANPFSAGGDSGSSIWTWNAARNPVALLFAGGGGVTFANRMTNVLSALDVHLYT
ncbi:MAG: S1 family peptidase [Acidobacteriota bacterium]|nr:S1 family peptidase [Acidobacteriota bacterium]